MRPGKPSVTARFVALTRAGLDRPQLPSGDAAAEARLYRTLRGPRLWRGSARWRARMARRTRFFDEAVLSAIQRGTTQVVIVGAGYDGRPLRFATPGVTWYEVDHPSTQSDKRARLDAVGASTDHIVFVPVDLIRDDTVGGLEAGGFSRSAASLFLVEGLLGYLPRSVAGRLLGDLRTLAGAGSRLAVAFPLAPTDFTAIQRLRQHLRGLVLEMLGEPSVTRFFDHEVDGLFATAGWKVAADTPQRRAGTRGVLVIGEPVGPGGL